MTADIENVPVVNNKEEDQFEIRSNGLVAKIPYNFKGDVIGYFHTEVPEAWRGKGLATKLTLHALNYAKDNNLLILPYCPFIAKYIGEHPEWKQYVKHFPSNID